MTSAGHKSNKETSRKMAPILFPARRFPVSSRIGITGGLPSASQAHDSNDVQWIGMNPLEMITNLARATEQAEAAKGILAGPIRIGDTVLSSETPQIPRLPKKRDGGHRKKRGAKDVTETSIMAIDDGPEPLPPWDPSFLLAKDEYAVEAVHHLQLLARSFESMPQSDSVQGSYRRIREHVAGTSEWIHTAYCGNLTTQLASEKMSWLQKLYAESIQQMEALVETTHMLGPKEEDAKTEAKPLVKREFTEYMVQWLKNHWTNPYPDDAGLEMMASDCGTTTTVVSNWLINARTRKWRPAIVKAFELKRPVDLLLEDSINLFDDKPLRELTDYEESKMMAPAPSNKRMKYY